MEKERRLLITKNQYWVSEIAELYFKYQLNYTTYSYMKVQVPGVDLVVMNKQLVPYYVLAYASTDEDMIPIPIMENDHASRLVNTESDFVFWWHVGTNKTSIIETQVLLDNFIDRDNYEDVGNTLVQWTAVDDPMWKGAMSQYRLGPDIADKANRIYDFRVSRLPLEQRTVPQPLELARVS
tara:strand:- start:61 stop:603 length:543 start_codon:yes stop_codon:yes gene_type:complete